MQGSQFGVVWKFYSPLQLKSMTTFKGMDLQWPSETSIWPIQILFWKLVGVNIWNSKRIPTPKKSYPRKQKFYHVKPRFEILHQYRCYFAHSLDWTFRTTITRKLLQNYAPVNTLIGYKLTSKGLGIPSETSIWNASPMKMLFFRLIVVMIVNSECIWAPQKSCP